jgi:hypothetical protein
MASRNISASDRAFVASRAQYRCEYCRVRAEDSFLSFSIDHIVSVKHGGGDEVENLAYACPHCNQYKGSDLTTFLDGYEDIVVLFNPRLQNWFDVFSFENGFIAAKTRRGEATVKLLRMNEPERVIQRGLLEEAGVWP